MLYGPGEVPVEPGPDGLIRIDREPDEVFRAETLASFEGKPVTIDHPEEFVSPSNWQQLAVGITQNVRRGQGLDDDCIVADLLITRADAINEVNDDLREVSCGYEADYKQLEPGKGAQLNIIGNHVALVERGRCGPRCAIGDKEPSNMSTKTKKRTFLDRIRTAFKAQDEAALDEALEEAKKATEDEGEPDDDESKADKSKTGDAAVLKVLTALGKRLDTQDAILKKLVKDAESSPDDEGKKKPDDETTDTVIEGEQAEANKDAGAKTYTGDAAFKDTISRAEILAPGFKLPTLDSKTKTVDAVCQCQRLALQKAVAGDNSQAVEPFLMGRDIASLTADQLHSVFVGASELVKAQNNAQGARRSMSTKDFGKTVTPADMNAQNRAFWSGRAGQ